MKSEHIEELYDWKIEDPFAVCYMLNTILLDITNLPINSNIHATLQYAVHSLLSIVFATPPTFSIQHLPTITFRFWIDASYNDYDKLEIAFRQIVGISGKIYRITNSEQKNRKIVVCSCLSDKEWKIPTQFIHVLSNGRFAGTIIDNMYIIDNYSLPVMTTSAAINALQLAQFSGSFTKDMFILE